MYWVSIYYAKRGGKEDYWRRFSDFESKTSSTRESPICAICSEIQFGRTSKTGTSPQPIQ